MKTHYSYIIKRVNSQQASWPVVCFGSIQNTGLNDVNNT